jgi:hypothetical protein
MDIAAEEVSLGEASAGFGLLRVGWIVDFCAMFGAD